MRRHQARFTVYGYTVQEIEHSAADAAVKLAGEGWRVVNLAYDYIRDESTEVVNGDGSTVTMIIRWQCDVSATLDEVTSGADAVVPPAGPA